MTDAQLKAWQRHVLDARRRVEQFQVAGYPTGVPEDAAILAADQELTAMRLIVDSECPVGALDLVTSLRVEKMHMAEALAASDAIVQAAREYVGALAEVTRVYDAGEMTVGDAQAICESKTDALVAAVGGADAAK